MYSHYKNRWALVTSYFFPVRLLAVFLAVTAVALANPLTPEQRFRALVAKPAAAKAQARLLEDLLHSVAECVRDTLNEGDETYSIPSFNPLSLESVTLDLSSLNIPEYITGYLELDDLYIEGITSWVFSDVSDKVSLIPLGYKIFFTVDIPKISGSGKDIGELTLLEQYIISADGSASGYVENIHASGSFFVTISGSSFAVKDVDIAVSVGDISFTISGLTVNGEDVSEAVSDFATNSLSAYINENAEAISQLISDLVSDASGSDSELIDKVIEIVKEKCIS